MLELSHYSGRQDILSQINPKVSNHSNRLSSHVTNDILNRSKQHLLVLTIKKAPLYLIMYKELLRSRLPEPLLWKVMRGRSQRAGIVENLKRKMHQVTLLSPKEVEVKWEGLPIKVTLRNVARKSDCTDIFFWQFISFFLFIKLYYQTIYEVYEHLSKKLIGKERLFTRGKNNE